MNVRRFLSDSQLNELVSSANRMVGEYSSAQRDQTVAAVRESSMSSLQDGSRALDRGFTGFVQKITRDGPMTTMERRSIRMLFAAVSANPEALCEHVKQQRPLIMSCDPVTIVCRSCLPKCYPEMNAPSRFPDECDACGSRSQRFTPVVWTAGYIQLIGNVCTRCSTPPSDPGLMKLGRNSRCFCNSGRKFKHCHGSFGQQSLTATSLSTALPESTDDASLEEGRKGVERE
jgi:hypothetical protein